MTRRTFLGLVAPVLTIVVGMSVCDDRLSRQLDNVDLTWEEVQR